MNGYTDDTMLETIGLTGRELKQLIWEYGSTSGKTAIIIFQNEVAAEEFYQAVSMAFDRVFYNISAIWPRKIAFQNGSEIILEVCDSALVSTSQRDETFYHINHEYADTLFDSNNELLDAYLKSFAIITDTV